MGKKQYTYNSDGLPIAEVETNDYELNSDGLPIGEKKNGEQNSTPTSNNPTNGSQGVTNTQSAPSPNGGVKGLLEGVVDYLYPSKNTPTPSAPQPQLDEKGFAITGAPPVTEESFKTALANVPQENTATETQQKLMTFDADKQKQLDINKNNALVNQLNKNNAYIEGAKRLQDNPNDEQGLMMVGNAFRDAGQVNSAKDFYGKVLSVNPNNQNAKQSLFEISPESGFDEYSKGYDLQTSGNLLYLPSAIQHYKNALTINPNNYKAKIALGGIDANNKNYEGAINYYTDALKNIPPTETLSDGKTYENPLFKQTLGQLALNTTWLASQKEGQEKQDLLNKAEQINNALLENNPEDILANQNKAYLEKQNGNDKEATKYLNKSIDYQSRQMPAPSLYKYISEQDKNAVHKMLTNPVGTFFSQWAKSHEDATRELGDLFESWGIERQLAGALTGAADIPLYIMERAKGIKDGIEAMGEGAQMVLSPDAGAYKQLQGTLKMIMGGANVTFSAAMLSPSGYVFTQGINAADVLTNGEASKIAMSPLQSYMPAESELGKEAESALDTLWSLWLFHQVHGVTGGIKDAATQNAANKILNGESLTGAETKLLNDYTLKNATPETLGKLQPIISSLPKDIKKEDILPTAIKLLNINPDILKQMPEDLTADQKIKIAPLLQKRETQEKILESVKEPFKPQVEEIIKDIDNQITNILKPQDNATTKIKQQESISEQHPQGDTSGKITETSSSDSLLGEKTGAEVGQTNEVGQEEYDLTDKEKQIVADYENENPTVKNENPVSETNAENIPETNNDVTFENAKKGDVVNHNGESVTVVEKTKSRGGNDIVIVELKPRVRTNEELEMDAATQVWSRHRNEYGADGATVSEIKQNHNGEFNNVLSDLKNIQETQKSQQYSIDKEQWDKEVNAEPQGKQVEKKEDIKQKNIDETNKHNNDILSKKSSGYIVLKPYNEVLLPLLESGNDSAATHVAEYEKATEESLLKALDYPNESVNLRAVRNDNATKKVLEYALNHWSHEVRFVAEEKLGLPPHEVEDTRTKEDIEHQASQEEKNITKEEVKNDLSNRNDFTDAKVLNKIWSGLKEKYKEREAKKIYDNATRLISPNENNIVEIRSNGVVTKIDDKYTFHPFMDTGMKNWRLSTRTVDISDQFEQPKEEKNIPSEKKEPTGEVTQKEIEAQRQQLIDLGVSKEDAHLAPHLLARLHKGLQALGVKADVFRSVKFGQGKAEKGSLKQTEDYSNWKRKNVSYRGVKGDTLSPNSTASGMLGRGLYTAPSSNKGMTSQYGERYYVVNALPKNPKVFDSINKWEIWAQGNLFNKFSKNEYPDIRSFNANTTIEAEMQKMGYDGIEIKGRETVNFNPENVKYFKTEDEVKRYFDSRQNSLHNTQEGTPVAQFRMAKMGEFREEKIRNVIELLHVLSPENLNKLSKEERKSVSDKAIARLTHEIGHLALHELLEQHKIDLEEYNSKVKGLEAKNVHKILNDNTWYRGIRTANEHEIDKFYSIDKSVAGDYSIDKIGDKQRMEELSQDDMPRNPLIVNGGKEDLAEKLGYTGDPLVEKLGTKKEASFDFLAKEYAKSNGHDAIIYTSGSMGEPELHLFEKPIHPKDTEVGKSLQVMLDAYNKSGRGKVDAKELRGGFDKETQQALDKKGGKEISVDDFNDKLLELSTLDLEDEQVKYPKIEGKKQTDIGSGKGYNLYILDRDKLPESGAFEISIQDDNGEPIGFIRGTKGGKVISFNLIHIKEENRGNGIGTDIYEKLLNDGYVIKSDKEITDATYSLYDNLQKNGYTPLEFKDGTVGLVKGKTEGAPLTMEQALKDHDTFMKGGETLKMTVNGKEVTVKKLPDDLEIVNGFYSPIEKTVRESKSEKWGTGEQAWNELKGKGLKADEVKWTGIEDWLKQQGKVTKADILDYLKNNRVQLVEVVKGGKVSDWSDNWEETEYGYKNGAFEIIKRGDGLYNLYNQNNGEQIGFGGFESLEGVKKRAKDEWKSNNTDTKFSQYTQSGEKSNYREIMLVLPEEKYGNYTVPSAHQYGDNISDVRRVGHIRIYNTHDAEGNKVLVMAEGQSDWGQKGKKEGFGIKEYTTNDVTLNKDGLAKVGNDNNSQNYFIRKRGNSWITESTSGYDTSDWNTEQEAKQFVVEQENRRLKQLGHQVPSAPFVTNTSSWVKLLLKHAIREGVKDGATKVTWETGETQNERYDLSKQVDEIVYEKYNSTDAKIRGKEEGKYYFSGKKDGKSIIHKDGVSEKELEEYLGKDVAKRIIDNEGDKEVGKRKSLKGDQLKVGGKGMIGFYGSPTEGKEGIVGKIAKEVVKELTGKEGKIGETKIDIANQDAKDLEYAKSKNGQWMVTDHNKTLKWFDTEQQAKAYIDKQQTSTQHSIEITPEVKAAVEQGMSLFQGKGDVSGDAIPHLRGFHEFIADSLSKYIKDGQTGFGKQFDAVMEKIKNILKEVYGAIKGNLVDKLKNTPELNEIFDKLLGKETNQANAPPKESTANKVVEGKDLEKKPINLKFKEVVDVNTPLRNEPVNKVEGSDGEVKFSDDKKVPFKYSVIEADDLQPSHLPSGERNPQHYIAGAQPKERNDLATLRKQDDIADNMNFGEVSGDGNNAYFGAPIVNDKGEVIQGNNRSIGIKKHYAKGKTEYKTELEKNADKYGLNKEQISKMKNPVLVRMVDVSDNEAVVLGNYDVKDLETGGKQRIDPITLSRRISPENKSKLASILFSGDATTIKDAIRNNAKAVFKIIGGELNPAQLKNLLNDKGEFTAAGMEDVEKLVMHFMFDGGKVILPEIFDGLPANIREGLKKSMPSLLNAKEDVSILPDVQNALIAAHEFSKSGAKSFGEWKTQGDIFKGISPEKIYTPLELKIAEKLIDATTQADIKKMFAEYKELTTDTPATLVDEARKGLSRQEAVKQIFKTDYYERENTPNEGKTGAKGTLPDEQEIKNLESKAESNKETNLNEVVKKSDELLNPAPKLIDEKYPKGADELTGNKPKEEGKILGITNKEAHDWLDNAQKKIQEGLGGKGSLGSNAGLIDALTNKAFKKIGDAIDKLYAAKEFIDLPNKDKIAKIKEIIDKELATIKKVLNISKISSDVYDTISDTLGKHLEDLSKNFKEEELPIEPPKENVEVKNEEGGKKEMSIIKRIRTSEKIKDNEQLVKLVTDKKSWYKVDKQNKARNYAKQVVDEFGNEEALKQARSNTYGGSVSSAIFAEVIDRKYTEESNAKTQKEKNRLAQEWADLAHEYATQANQGGKFNSQVYDFYKKSPMGMALYAEKVFTDIREELLAKHEGDVKKAFDELISEEPIKGEFENRLFNVEKYKKTKKDITDFWDKAKIDTKKNTGAYIIPPQLINGAIEVMKQAHLAGHEVKAIVQKGIDYLNEHIKDAWDEDKFRVEQEQKLQAFLDKGRRKPLEQKEKDRVLNKWRKRLKGLTDEERKSFLGKVLTQIAEKGGLEYEDFRQMYADALGLPTLTPEVKDQLRQLATDINGLDKAREKLEGIENPTNQDIKDFQTAQLKAQDASKLLNEKLARSKGALDTLLNIGRLNTLTPKSLIGNPIFNIAFMPARFGESMTATALDYILPRFGDKNIPSKYRNTLSAQRYAFMGMGEGGKKAIEQLYSGMTDVDYFEKEVRQNINPQKAWHNLSSWAKGKSKLTKGEIISNLIEGTTGILAEAKARLLGLGDKPFRDMAGYVKAYELGRAKGYTGNKLKAFMLAPDEVSGEIIRKAGEEAIMAQENMITHFIDHLGKGAKSLGEKFPYGDAVGKGAKVVGTLTQPFLKIPLNAAIRTAELALPEYSFMRALYESSPIDFKLNKKTPNREEAIKYYSRGITGFALKTVLMSLATAGLIIPDDDEDAKERNIIEQYFSGGSLNYSAFKRWMNGGDATYKDGDTLVSLYYFGVMGALAKMYGTLAQEEQQKGKDLSYLSGLNLRFTNSLANGIKNNVFGGTATLLNAINMGGNYVDNWVRGMAGVAENTILPSEITTASKSIPEYKVDLSQGSLPEKLLNDLKVRLFLGDNLPSKITMWGDKVENTQSKSVGGRMLYYAFDIRNPKTVDVNNFGYQLALEYQKTGDNELFPPKPKNEFTYDGKKITLTPKQYEEFQIMVGSNRKSLAEPFLEGYTSNDVNGYTHDELVKELQSIYDEGYNYGKDQFMELHPELQPQ